VGGGPCGVSCALNIRRADPTKQVTLYFSGDQPLVGYHPTAQDYYDKLLKDAGVTLQNNDRAIVPSVTPASGLINFESGASAEAETILWTVGNREPHSQYLPTELLDAEGFVKTQSTLEVEGSDTIFAIGDVASTDPDRSSARNWAYGILVNNIKRKAAGKSVNQFYKPPPNRWGSIVGPQADGLTLHQHTGKRVRLSRWLVDNVLLPTVVQRMIYRGVARSVD
jgi:NADH dehydrogenase FAD-containing subunit